MRAVGLHTGSLTFSFIASTVFPIAMLRVTLEPLTLSTLAVAHVSFTEPVGGVCSDTLSDTRPGVAFCASRNKKYVPGASAEIESDAAALDIGASHACVSPVQPARKKSAGRTAAPENGVAVTVRFCTLVVVKE